MYAHAVGCCVACAYGMKNPILSCIHVHVCILLRYTYYSCMYMYICCLGNMYVSCVQDMNNLVVYIMNITFRRLQ